MQTIYFFKRGEEVIGPTGPDWPGGGGTKAQAGPQTVRQRFGAVGI